MTNPCKLAIEFLRDELEFRELATKSRMGASFQPGYAEKTESIKQAIALLDQSAPPPPGEEERLIYDKTLRTIRTTDPDRDRLDKFLITMMCHVKEVYEANGTPWREDDEERFSAIRALILAPPKSVTREELARAFIPNFDWQRPPTEEHPFQEKAGDVINRLEALLREKGIAVEPAGKEKP